MYDEQLDRVEKAAQLRVIEMTLRSLNSLKRESESLISLRNREIEANPEGDAYFRGLWKGALIADEQTLASVNGQIEMFQSLQNEIAVDLAALSDSEEAV